MSILGDTMALPDARHYRVAALLDPLMPEEGDLPPIAFTTAVDMIVEARSRACVSAVLRVVVPIELPVTAHEVIVDLVMVDRLVTREAPTHLGAREVNGG